MQICVLASGSSGNSLLVQEDQCALIIDAGFSSRTIQSRIRDAGLNPRLVAGIIVSHEHSDHVRGISALARDLKVPIYTNGPTLEGIKGLLKGKERIEVFENGKPIHIGAFELYPFSVSHDALDPVGFTITDGKIKIGITTDLGYVSLLVLERLKGSRLIVLESNHDLDMLLSGPYSWPLKQRIMSRIGHLSNVEASETLASLATEGTEIAIMAHLSQENNTPELVIDTAKTTLVRNKIKQLNLHVASQDKTGPVFEL